MIKILHTSDLHLGKKLLGVSRLYEQRLFLDALMRDIDIHKPDVLLIAGDIYDRAIPPEDAVSLFDTFLERLAAFGIVVVMIGGNHDSAKRLGIYNAMLTKQNLYIYTDFKQALSPIELVINGQAINFYAVPYSDPRIVSYQLDNPEIKTHDDVFNYLTHYWTLDKNAKNILIAHGYFGSTYEATDSEKPLSIGGTDIVSISHLKAFDYCALGHLHRPQKISDNAYYSGSPLKYSFSEHRDNKRYLILNVAEDIKIASVPIDQPIDVAQLAGKFDDLLTVGDVNNDYLSIHLSDKLQLHDPLARLRFKYPNLLKLTFDYLENNPADISVAKLENKNTIQHFDDFYRQIYDEPMADDLKVVLNDVLTGLL